MVSADGVKGWVCLCGARSVSADECKSVSEEEGGMQWREGATRSAKLPNLRAAAPHAWVDAASSSYTPSNVLFSAACCEIAMPDSAGDLGVSAGSLDTERRELRPTLFSEKPRLIFAGPETITRGLLPPSSISKVRRVAHMQPLQLSTKHSRRSSQNLCRRCALDNSLVPTPPKVLLPPRLATASGPKAPKNDRNWLTWISRIENHSSSFPGSR